MLERVPACRRHLRVPFEIEHRIEQRMRVRTLRRTHGQVVRERLAARGSDVRVLREIEGHVEQPIGRPPFPDSLLQIMQERVALCFCGPRLFQVPLHIEQRMRQPAFSRTRNHEVHERGSASLDDLRVALHVEPVVEQAAPMDLPRFPAGRGAHGGQHRGRFGWQRAPESGAPGKLPGKRNTRSQWFGGPIHPGCPESQYQPEPAGCILLEFGDRSSIVIESGSDFVQLLLPAL